MVELPLLVDALRVALTAKANGAKCPYTDKPPADTPVHTVPDTLKPLLLLTAERQEYARRMAERSGRDDNGVWYSRQQDAEALEHILRLALLSRHRDDSSFPLRSVNYYQEWKYSVR